MLRFTIRDVLWLIVVVAVALGVLVVRQHRQTRWDYRRNFNLNTADLIAEGDKGWELVAVTEDQNHGTVFYFKKPK